MRRKSCRSIFNRSVKLHVPARFVLLSVGLPISQYQERTGSVPPAPTVIRVKGCSAGALGQYSTEHENAVTSCRERYGVESGCVGGVDSVFKACVVGQAFSQPTNGMFPSEASPNPGPVLFHGHPECPPAFARDLLEGSSTNPQSRGLDLAPPGSGVFPKRNIQIL